MARLLALCALIGLIAASAQGASDRPLPPPVDVRQEPDAGVTLGDPSFEALPGARADFGRLGGSVYQIEVPAKWNGRLLLFMHGFESLGPVANVTPPGFRRYLIGQGYAWGASSFSSTSLIPGRAADETAALWDLFARRYGRPDRTYVTGQSMGGAATHVAAERYADRFDGALAMCGAAGQTPAAAITTDFFAAAAYATGVTQRDFDRRSSIGALIHDRILLALGRPRARRRFEAIMISLTGGHRAFDREGFRLEEQTNWQRAEQILTFGIASNLRTVYRLGPPSPVTSRQFNRGVVRVAPNDAARAEFLAGSETTGNLQMPLVSIYTTGDGQVPVEQARVLRRRVDAAGRRNLLVQRVFRDAGHCGFTNTEKEASLEALVRWVEHGVRPSGDDVLVPRLTDLRRHYELNPRPGTPEAKRVRGARRRVVLHGKLRLDGAPFDSRFLGAVVRRRDGLITPCQLTLPMVRDGRYEITLVADAEASGCGVPGAEIALWTFDGTQILFSRRARAWPRAHRARFDASFSSATPDGTVPRRTQFAGEVFRSDGHQLGGGTRVEAFVGTTRCGLASVRRTGSYSGFSLDIVGPDAIPGCTRGSTLTFRVNGRPTLDTAVNEPGRSGSLDLTVS